MTTDSQRGCRAMMFNPYARLDPGQITDRARPRWPRRHRPGGGFGTAVQVVYQGDDPAACDTSGVL